MKSAVFYGKHDLRIQDIPRPAIGPDEVLIQVKACGICGTDVHIYEGDEGAAKVTAPTILGHEFAGIVVEIGERVKGLMKGDRVCADPNCYCGMCGPCRKGLVHYCENMIGYGTTVNGGFAEYCAVNARQIYKLGEHTSFEAGAMAEPAACCLHGIEMCEISMGEKVVIVGGGMIGLLMLQLARLAGASRIALIEPVEEKRRLAADLGADLCIDPWKEEPGAVLAANGMDEIRTVIECVGSPAAIQQAISLAGNRAIVMMFGLTRPDETVEIHPFECFKKELTLKASYINPHTQGRALELIDSGRLDVTSMIGGVCGFNELEDILSSPERRSRGKYILVPRQ